MVSDAGRLLNYEEGNTYDADMHLIFDEARGNSAEAEHLYAERFPNRWTPSRHFEHKLCITTSVFICLFHFPIHKLFFFIFHSVF
jgi:hypothetical protein